MTANGDKSKKFGRLHFKAYSIVLLKSRFKLFVNVYCKSKETIQKILSIIDDFEEKTES